MKLFLGKNTFFSKLLFRFFLITMIVIIIFGFSVIFYFKTFFIEQKESQIKEHNSAVIEYLAKSLANDDNQDVVNWLNIVGKLNGGQAWLIDSEGYLNFSYPYSFDEEKRFSSHEAIFAGKTISRKIESTDFNNTMLLIGMPIKYNEEIIAALLVFTPIQEIEAANNQVTRLMIFISLFAAFVILIIAYFWSRSLAEPLAKIGDTAFEISQGSFGKKVDLKKNKSGKEINILAKSINTMSVRLEKTINNLADEKNKLEYVLAGMEEGIIAVDHSGKIILSNQAVSKLLGTKKNIMGQNIENIALEKTIVQEFKQLLKKKEENKQQIINGKQNKNHLLVHFSLLDFKNKEFKGAVAIFHDISERYRFEELQREFVANVSHELRSPLSSIKGSAELLLDGVINNKERKREYLKMILKESDSLSHLIDETLTLAEIDAGEVELKRDKIKIKELFNNLAVFFNNIQKDKQSLELSVDGDLFIWANQEKIRQVLINFISNSVKYSPADGKINLKATNYQGEVKISVEDNGIGIPQTELKNIWERFYKVDKARTPEKKSSGLGLAIVKEIIEEHKGRVFVESEMGKGSTFGFFIAGTNN